VRPRAWALAQRRHTARLWHRTRDLSAQDRAVLDALHKLPVVERRALLMAELAGLPQDVIARELGVTRDTLRQQVQVGRARFAAVLDIDVERVREPLLALGDAAARASLPRPSVVRRQGKTRRRTHTVVAVVAATVLAVASGAFAHEPAGEQAVEADPLVTDPGSSPSVEPVPEPTLPSGEDLLAVSDVRPLAPAGAWEETKTHDNTAGTGVNYVCQQERFADPDGLATIVRELGTTKGPSRTVVQAVEISRSRSQAETTFDTVESWLASCTGGELHLQQTYDVQGIADQARVMRLRAWGKPQATHTVAFAQVGAVVTTVVLRAADGQAPGARKMAQTLAAATEMLCERAGDGDCGGRPELEKTAPPPTEEAPRMLSTVDLPPLLGVRKPWVGTEAAPAPRNPASTSCDRAEFRRAGAERARTRTFLVPEAGLPNRFGLTQTYGTFPSKKEAAAFMRTVRQRFAGCEDRDLATDVLAPASVRGPGLNGSTWRLRTELSESREVLYDVGFVRNGSSVTQLTFVPAEQADLRAGAFRALVLRAGQRLGEPD
jgi:hypothetical protein